MINVKPKAIKTPVKVRAPKVKVKAVKVKAPKVKAIKVSPASQMLGLVQTPHPLLSGR